MTELHLPWLLLTLLTTGLGAVWVARTRDPGLARRRAVGIAAAAFALTVGAWVDYASLNVERAVDRGDVAGRLFGAGFLGIDALSAPLFSMSALLCLLTSAATPSTKVRRFSFASSLASEVILLATLACESPSGIVALLALGTLPPALELRARKRPRRVYVLHMLLFVVTLAAGWWLVAPSAFANSEPSTLGLALLIVAVLVRCGIAPLHCWMTDLFEHAAFGTSLLFVTPMVGAYAAIRLLLPVAPDWALHWVVWMSLATAVYAAAMALIQREARRFFCYLFLSHSALVLVGLETTTLIGLTGGLSVWLSVGLALGGFGVTLRSMEARTGRLSLADFHGLYEQTPTLAVFFLLTGLASVGFPGTFGFVGMELLVDGAVQSSLLVGFGVLFAAALNGIAVLQVYFRIFTGTRHAASVPLRTGMQERIAVLALALLILGGGLFPQPGVASRYRAAQEIAASRRGATPTSELHEPPVAHATGPPAQRLFSLAEEKAPETNRP